MSCSICGNSSIHVDVRLCITCGSIACDDCIRKHVMISPVHPMCYQPGCPAPITVSSIIIIFGEKWYKSTYLPSVYDAVYKEQMSYKDETVLAISTISAMNNLIEVRRVKQQLIHSTPTWRDMGDMTERFRVCNTFLGMIRPYVDDYVLTSMERVCSYSCTFHYRLATRNWMEKQLEMVDLRIAYFSGKITTDLLTQRLIRVVVDIRLLESRIVQLQRLSGLVFDRIKWAHDELMNATLDDSVNHLVENTPVDVLATKLKKLAAEFVHSILVMLSAQIDAYRKDFNATVMMEGLGFEERVQCISNEWSG